MASGDVKVSEHGYDELVNDHLSVREVVNGFDKSLLVEDYPDFPKGAAILLLQYDKNDRPIHVVWGIPKSHDGPAVLITAYQPDLKLWDDNFRERVK